MRSPRFTYTVAAALVLAALIGTHFLNGTSSVAWATVLETVRDIDNYIYRIREIETTGPRPDGFEFATEGQTTVYHSVASGYLEERAYAGVELFSRYYWLRQTNECIGICYPLERYERRPLSEGWSRDSRDPRQTVLQVLQSDYVSLGRDKIAGRFVEGVQINDADAFAPHVPTDLDDFSANVWIDVQSQLPVWVEVSYVEKGSALCSTLVMDQFQWGAELDADLFRPEIPDGFALNNHEKPKPDSIPVTDSVRAFENNVRDAPYLGEFDRLELPDLADLTLLDFRGGEVAPEMRLTTHDEVWQAQDRFVAEWPGYDQVRARLHQELQAKLGIDQMGVDALMAASMALRERFWDLGGCLSSGSYPCAYAARLVAEMAHRQAPDDMGVTDQLVESITTYELMWIHDPDPEKRIANPIYTGFLTELRLQQFDQIRQAAAQGLVPTWRDFVRIQDLAFLLNARRKDFTGALEVVDWLIGQTETAGWTPCSGSLERMQETLLAGESFVPAIFANPVEVYPEGYRYGRRLCSFQGPRRMRENLVPFHQRHR